MDTIVVENPNPIQQEKLETLLNGNVTLQALTAAGENIDQKSQPYEQPLDLTIKRNNISMETCVMDLTTGALDLSINNNRK